MISEQELRSLCPSRTFQRGRQIAASDTAILTKKCRYDVDGTVLSAFMASSRGWNESYRTSATIDEEDDRLIDYACSCPDYFTSEGPCKHCVALVLSYNQAPERFMGFKESRMPETSPCLAEFMRRAEQAARSGEIGSVSLEPIFSYGYRAWSVHFRIAGSQGSYVLRDIGEFVECMRAGRFFSYGKNLSFSHTPEAFTERGRALARFLDRAVASRASGERGAFGHRSASAVGRSLDLADFELIDLLDLMGGDTFTVEGTDYGIRAKTRAHIVEENPYLELRITTAERGGFGISRDDDVAFAAHGDRMYVWIDDVFYRCTPEFAQCAPFLRAVFDNESDRLFISERDMPLFCATILPEMEKRLCVRAPERINVYRPVPCTLEFFFDRTPEGVTCDAAAVYDERRFPLVTPDTVRAPSSFVAASRSSAGDGTQSSRTKPGPLRDERKEETGRALMREFFELAVGREPEDVLEDASESAAEDGGSGAHDDADNARVAYVPGEPRVFARINNANEDDIARLIFGGLARFQQLGQAFTTPDFDRLLSDRKPRMSMGLSLAGNLINLTVSSDDMPPEELGALLASYRRRKRYHRLKSGVFVDLADFDLAELDRIASDLGITADQLARGTVELPAYRAFYLDEQLADARRDGEFMRYVDRLRTADEEPRPVPAALCATLRPYQQEGLRWMNALADMEFGGILADEMGLGKSVQAIAFLLTRMQEAPDAGPSLIVCPASLVYNWLAEIERFAPTINAAAVVGTKRERAVIRATSDADVLVTSYDIARIDADAFAETPYFCLLLDEAQYIKNHGTLTARNVKRLRAQHRFALTGTPMENRLSEIWSIFDFLMPGFLGSYMRFREKFELDIIGGDESVAARLQALIGPFMLRRLKTDVLPDLPDKLESVVYAHMEREQQRLYDAHEQCLRESLTQQRRDRKQRSLTGSAPKRPDVEVLAEIARLRQICCDPRLLYENFKGEGAKLAAIMDLVEQAMAGGQKTLVFSQFTGFLALIAQKLDEAGVPYYTITGATPKRQRVELVDAFNEDETPVFLVSLKAGGTGLNLIGASVVVHADPWWNAAAQNQATDRAHRIGQTQVVSVHKVIAKGTIEERIVHLQEMKSELAETVVGAENMPLSSLTQEDLLDLLEG